MGPKYHPLKPGAWRHASPLGDDWLPPPPDAGPNAGEPPALNRHYTHRLRRTCGGTSGSSEVGVDGDALRDSTRGETSAGYDEDARRERGGGNVALFMMMGAALQPVSSVPAGNVLALAGLEGRVNKCATLSDVPECPAMRAVTLQVGGGLARVFFFCLIESFDVSFYAGVAGGSAVNLVATSVDFEFFFVRKLIRGKRLLQHVYAQVDASDEERTA